MIPQLFAIEFKEAGVWVDHEYADNMVDAARIASKLTWFVREEWIRIVTPDNKIL